LPARPSPRQNGILAALPAADYARLRPDLEFVPMPLGWAACESGGQMNYIYFPTTSIVSLLYVTVSGASAELASPCSWVEERRQAGQSCKARDSATGSKPV
jgi:hypothetical protein